MLNRYEQLSPEKREQIKGSKLEYLYHIPESYAHLPLLGSAVRALGREWVVEVDFSSVDLFVPSG